MKFHIVLNHHDLHKAPLPTAVLDEIFPAEEAGALPAVGTKTVAAVVPITRPRRKRRDGDGGGGTGSLF